MSLKEQATLLGRGLGVGQIVTDRSGGKYRVTAEIDGGYKIEKVFAHEWPSRVVGVGQSFELSISGDAFPRGSAFVNGFNGYQESEISGEPMRKRNLEFGTSKIITDFQVETWDAGRQYIHDVMPYGKPGRSVFQELDPGPPMNIPASAVINRPVPPMFKTKR